MNEPKRRGRPPKVSESLHYGPPAEIVPTPNAVGQAPIVLLTPKVRTPEMEQAIADVEAWSKEPTESADGKLVSIHRRSTIHELSQAYANRVWAGQSPSLPYGERWYRVKVALEAQGMSMDGVVLK